MTRLVFGRFCDLVSSITEEAFKCPEEGDCDTDALEVRWLPILKLSVVLRLYFFIFHVTGCFYYIVTSHSPFQFLFLLPVNLFTFHHKPLLSTSLRQKKCGKIVSVFATSCFASKVLLKCHRKCDSFIQSSEKVFVFDRENSYSPSLKANTPRFKAYIISPVFGGFFAH